MSEPEPRRSVRSTKGQHKGLPETLDQPIEPKRRGKKAVKKQAEPEPEEEEEEEEVIRCVCGATTQDPDESDEPWIACDDCHVWQHNICVGVSTFDEDLEDIEYFCEQCRPEQHKELLDAMKKGVKLWEKRRKEHEQEKAAKKQKKGSKKGKKRQEPQEDARQTSAKSSASPAPEKKAAGSKATSSKRKDRHDSADAAAVKEPSKLRKVSDNRAVVPAYEPPKDLPNALSELPDGRQGPAKLLQKSLLHALTQHEKKNGYNPVDGVSNESRAERLAIAIERAVQDTHASQPEYAKQCRALGANLKTNGELIIRLLDHTLTPPMLAVMNSDDLATEKQQQETAAAKERSVRQSIIATDDAAPRYRKTHKGDELIDNDNFAGPSSGPSVPQRQPPPEQSSKTQPLHVRKSSGGPAQVDGQQQSPTTNFDINKVFSSVKSPTAAQRRRSSAAPAAPQGPGVDPDVDRLLEDDAPDSPPYSPAEETDPDVVWRGQLIMAATADFQVVAKHVAGANLAKTIGLPWTQLLPRKLNVGGRIAMNSATEYLCSQRWNNTTDLIIVTLAAATEDGKEDFDKLFNYFVTRERWAVVGEKGVGNVKDTYLVPVPAGSGNQPEFLLNLEDNFLPHSRTDNILLLVIVFRNDENTLRKLHGPEWDKSGPLTGPPPAAATHAPSASPSPAVGVPQRSTSMAGPAFSPTTPQIGPGGFTAPHAGHNGYAQHAAQPGPSQQSPDDKPLPTPEQQRALEARAREILGPYALSTNAQFLMPHAYRMDISEWQTIRNVMEKDPKARDDLRHMGLIIQREADARDKARKQAQQQQQSAPPQQPQDPQQQQQFAVQQPPALPPQNTAQFMPPVPVGAVPPKASASPSVPPQQQVPPLGQPSPTPRRTPISLPPIPGMPASVHQSYQAAQAQAAQAQRHTQSPSQAAAPPT